MLVIDGRESPGVSKIGGLSEGELETVEQPDAGSFKVYKLAGPKIKFESLTIERDVDGSPEDQRFKDWFQESFKLNRTDQGGSGPRRNGMIVKRHNGADVLDLRVLWCVGQVVEVHRHGSGVHQPLKQTIVLEHEGLERVA